jgi:hypothetical protein
MAGRVTKTRTDEHWVHGHEGPVSNRLLILLACAIASWGAVAIAGFGLLRALKFFAS